MFSDFRHLGKSVNTLTGSQLIVKRQWPIATMDMDNTRRRLGDGTLQSCNRCSDRFFEGGTTVDIERQTLSIMKACEVVGVSRRTIYNWMAGGKVEYVRTAGGSVRIFADSLWRAPQGVQNSATVQH
jgi:excisionase family DNA binding protein